MLWADWSLNQMIDVSTCLFHVHPALAAAAAAATCAVASEAGVICGKGYFGVVSILQFVKGLLSVLFSLLLA